MTTTPTIARVEVETVTYDDGERAVRIDPIWTATPELDRPSTGGWNFPDTPRGRSLAKRLEAAILAGAVFADVEVVRDVYGQTYVKATRRVMGKYANADLKKLGF